MMTRDWTLRDDRLPAAARLTVGTERRHVECGYEKMVSAAYGDVTPDLPDEWHRLLARLN